MATAPILELATLLARPPIRVDGETYHLKSTDELSLIESQQFGAWGAELERLAKDPERQAECEALLSKVAREVLVDMPAEVFGRLSTMQQMAIVEVFTGLLLSRRLRLAGAIGKAAKQPTGASSSPASSMSMAATPGGGSTAPRLHS